MDLPKRTIYIITKYVICILLLLFFTFDLLLFQHVRDKLPLDS